MLKKFPPRARTLPFDHSPAGLDRHATAWFEYLLKQYRAGRGSLIWWDIEDGYSVNVPSSVRYVASKDGPYAACYRYNTEERLRREAVRFQSEVARRLITLAKRAGIRDFEMGSYNVPNLPVVSARQRASIYQLMAAEVHSQLMCPYFAFGGPSCYFSGTKAMVNGGWSIDQFIADRVGVVKHVRAAFGPSYKMIPAIWARWFISNGNVRANYPGGTWMLPRGALGKMAKALLEAGADGFVIWRSSADDDDAAAFSARYE